MSDAPAPAPGIYPDVPFAEYLEWDAVSNSSLHAATRSMKHYHEQKPVEETPAMKLGTLCHAGRFEPLTIAQAYVVMPRFEEQVRKPNGDKYDNPKVSSAYKELVAEFRQNNSGKIIVTEHEYDCMLGMVRALGEHERANEYLAARPTTQFEVAIVWREPDTGLLCKGRCDALQWDIGQVGDLKTSRDVARFENVIANYSYYRQMAFYTDGLFHLTQETFSATITAVENAHPFGVRAAPLSEDAIEVGRTEYRSLLRQIAEAKATKVWRGYSSPVEWTLPAWKQPDTMQVVDGLLTSW